MLTHSDRQRSLLVEKEWVARKWVDGHTWSGSTGQHCNTAHLKFRFDRGLEKTRSFGLEWHGILLYHLILGKEGWLELWCIPIRNMMVKHEEIRD